MRTVSRPSLSPGPRSARRPARGEEGAVAVEAAIVMPLILLMLFGIIDFGRALQQQTLLVTAVREGARTGALNGTNTQVTARVTSIAGTDVSLTTIALCTNSSTTTAEAKITAEQPFTALTPVFALMQIYGQTTTLSTLKATGVMLCTG